MDCGSGHRVVQDEYNAVTVSCIGGMVIWRFPWTAAACCRFFARSLLRDFWTGFDFGAVPGTARPAGWLKKAAAGCRSPQNLRAARPLFRTFALPRIEVHCVRAGIRDRPVKPARGLIIVLPRSACYFQRIDHWLNACQNSGNCWLPARLSKSLHNTRKCRS